MMNMKRLAKNVRAIRQQRGLSQTAVAKRAGVTQAAIAMLETDKTVNPTLGLLMRVAKVLKCKVGDLVD